MNVKGCTHRVMILCDGAVDSHRKEKSKAIAQWEDLSCAIYSYFRHKKNTESTYDGFRPMFNISDI